MASSLLTGDRRWAPTRKSGMTVLGKVPKPINLPSQRLENHGLDPNVEIVPKGTHTWGSSRQSSAAPNAWGSSNLSSPNTDGSAGSPSHVNGRPSSGGSGTRPSTAGSDRSHEPASNAWGPNLRPSSASGILASNQISQTAGRPRSAETRPGSSQLSRFAENAVDTPIAWGATGTAERLGSFSSKTNSFTLSSGDFPTLGSEKSSDSQTQRGHSSQGRPASSSGTISAKKETLGPELAGNKNSDISVQGNVNTWRAENHHSLVHSAPPNMENWQKDPHQGQSYPGSDVPPHQFESWHNAPFHPSNGVWYRGGPAGGLYRPPGPPGNYPVEPYYPHVPARPLPNVQSFPRPEAGPAGYHPKNGDSYRPHMPLEAYMVPSHSAIPIRPGVFQGPVPYEGYYGPHHGGFSSSSDREGPVMGMAARPGVYNQYPTQNVNIDPGHLHARPGGYSPVMNKEQMKSDTAHETQGQYRVLLKQHDNWEDHGQREKGEQAVISGSSHTERGKQPVSTRDGDWRTDSTEGGNQPVSTRDGDWRTDSRKHEPAPLQPAGGREGYSSDTIVRNSSQDSSKVAGDNMTRKSVTGTVQIRNIQQYPVTKKNATLMEKVEGLNSKARITDSHSETGIVSSKGKTKNLKDVSSSADHFEKVICATAAPTESASGIGVVKPIPCEAIASTGDGNEVLSIDQNMSSGPSESQAYVLSKSKTVESGENTHFQHQKRTPSSRGVDHPAKLRSSRHDNDEWMKKSTARDSSANNIVKNGESKPGTCVSEYHPSQEATDRQELHVAGSVVGGSYSASPLDSFDQKAQRAKIKEIAIQRAKQLQKEEEERTREQKAKALAKLEELNRRSLADSSNLKSNNVATPSNDILSKSEADAGSAPVADATLTEAPSCTSACDSEAASKKSDVGESAELPPHETAQASDSATQTFIVPQNQFMSMGQDKKTTEIAEKMTDIHDIAGSRQKQMGYRRRQNTQEKHLDEKQATLENTGSPKYVGKVASNAPSSDTLLSSEDPSVQHRKKNNRGTRNRNTRDESMLSPSRSSAQTESTSEKCVTESGNTKPSETLAVALSGPDESLNETGGTQVSKNAVAAPSKTTTNQEWSDSTEEIHGKASNLWKPHPHRKSNRGQQAHKPVTKHHGTEAVIWAPVRTANKNEPSEKVNQTSTTETTNRSPGKVGHDVHNGVKAKRAEIERYVPKPVAKELSQQGNSQQTSSLSQTASDDSGIPEPVSPRGGSGKSDALTVGKASFASDSKDGEGSKHNQYGRTQASWRQRGSAESLSPQNLVEGAFDTTKVVQKGSDQLQPSKIDSLQARQPDNWSGDNDLATPGESETIASAKNEGTSRQRRHPYKTHRVAGGNYAAADNKNLHRGMANRIDTQPPVLSLKSENQNSSGDHIKSQWQPKPQTHTYYGRQGNRSSGGQRATSQVGYSDKELPPQGPVNNYMQNEDNSEPSQETVGGEARGADAAKRERKAIPDLNQDFPSTGESRRANSDPQQAQSYPSEVHQRGQYNGRFQRGQDAGRQTLQVNGDKRKNNQNLEYQRVGSYHKPSESLQQNPDAGEEAHEGPRYREKGRHNPRGGGGGRHYYGRSGGPRVGDYHDGRE